MLTKVVRMTKVVEVTKVGAIQTYRKYRTRSRRRRGVTELFLASLVTFRTVRKFSNRLSHFSQLGPNDA